MFYPNVVVAECDSCKTLDYSDEADLLIDLGWTQDDRDATFCPTCSEARNKPEDAPTEEEAEAFVAAIEKEAEPLLEEKERQKAEAIKAQAKVYGAGWNKRIAMIKAKKVKARLKGEIELLERHEELEKLGALEEFFQMQGAEIVRSKMEES